MLLLWINLVKWIETIWVQKEKKKKTLWISLIGIKQISKNIIQNAN